MPLNGILFFLLFFLAAVIVFSSCSRRQYGDRSRLVVQDDELREHLERSKQLENNERNGRAEQLSLRLNVPLTPNDNLNLYEYINGWIGVPHRLGKMSKSGTDCSGFVYMVYNEVYGKQLRRTSADMLKINCRRVEKSQLREGDLVFFYNKNRSQTPSHVGIYLKEGRFVHASSSHGVTVNRLDEKYYVQHWMCGGTVK